MMFILVCSVVQVRKEISLEEEVRLGDEYELEKKVMTTLRHGTDIYRQGYWSILISGLLHTPECFQNLMQ
jgi:hypothetical protein